MVSLGSLRYDTEPVIARSDYHGGMDAGSYNGTARCHVYAVYSMENGTHTSNIRHGKDLDNETR